MCPEIIVMSSLTQQYLLNSGYDK